MGFLYACIDGERGPLPSILLRSSHQWVFFRLMRHLQQVAAFFPSFVLVLCSLSQQTKLVPLAASYKHLVVLHVMFLKEHSYIEVFIGSLMKFCVSPSKELPLGVVFPVCPPTLMKPLSRLSAFHISVTSALALADPMVTESCCKACLCNPFI